MDIFLTNNIEDITRSQIKKIILSGGVIINEKTIFSSSEKIKGGDKIKIILNFNKGENIKSKDIKLDIVYDDKEIVIVNKPSGLTVHPGAGNKDNTLVNGLMHVYKKNLSNLGGTFRPGIVHRIDKDTSGVIVIAKNYFSLSN